jgi:hypothetical protein
MMLRKTDGYENNPKHKLHLELIKKHNNIFINYSHLLLAVYTSFPLRLRIKMFDKGTAITYEDIMNELRFVVRRYKTFSLFFKFRDSRKEYPKLYILVVPTESA